MEVIGLIITLVIFAVLIIAVVKKVNMWVTLTLLTLVAGFAVIALGASGITPKTGNQWLDVFEYLPTYFGTTFAGTALVIFFVVAFSKYMAEIGASQRLAEALAKPVLKIKNPILLLTVSTVISFLLMMVLPSAMGVFVVCLGVMFPTLVKAGINPISIMLSFFIGCNVVLGPANPFAVLVLGYFTGDGVAPAIVASTPDPATFFISIFPMAFISIILTGIVCGLWNTFLDRKVEKFPEVSEDALPKEAECDAPGWYALFPIVPVVLLIVFSRLTGVGIIFSVAGAYFFSLVILWFVHWLRSKDKKEAFNGFAHFYEYFGDVMKSPVIIVCLSMLFGNVIAKVGGLGFLVNMLIETFGLGWEALLVVTTILYFIMCIFVGNSIAIPVCVPIIIAAMTTLGMESQVLLAACLMSFVGGLGKSLTPYEPKYLYISEMCNGYDTMDLVKRNSVPIIFALVVTLILSFVML